MSYVLTPPTVGWRCTSACNAMNATPACLLSRNDSLRTIVRPGVVAWLPLLQWPTNQGPAVGWQHPSCDSNYTNWALGQPNDGEGPQSCVAVDSSSLWDDEVCAATIWNLLRLGVCLPPINRRLRCVQLCGYKLPCVCENTAPVSGISTVVSGRLTENEAAERAWAERTVIQFIVAALLLVLVPPCLVAGYAWFRRRGRGSFSPAVEPTTPERGCGSVVPAVALRLDKANDSAVEMRRQVSMLLLRAGWILSIFSILPTIFVVTLGWPSPLAGHYLYYVSAYPVVCAHSPTRFHQATHTGSDSHW